MTPAEKTLNNKDVEGLAQESRFEQKRDPAGVINVMPADLAGPMELMGRAWEVTKSRFWPLLLSLLIPGFMAGGLTMILVFPLLMTGVLAGAAGGNNLLPVLGIGAVLTLLGMGLVITITATWLGVALIELIAGAEEKLGLIDAWKKAWPKIWGTMWVGILSGLVIMGGFVPLVIPAYIIIMWLAFSQMVYVVEGTGGLKALRISREYVRGRFWGVLGRLLFPMLLFLGLGIAEGVLGAMMGEETAKIVSLLFSLVSLPLLFTTMVYQYELYKNLKEVRGGPIDPSQVEEGKTKWVLLAIWGAISLLIIPAGAILMLILINPAAQLEKARQADTQFDMQIIGSRLMQYYTDKGQYPGQLQDMVPAIMNEVPQGSYEYRTVDNGQGYELCNSDGEEPVCVQSEPIGQQLKAEDILYQESGTSSGY